MSKQTRNIVALVVILVAVLLGLSRFTIVDSGNVGVKFNKYGSDKGIDIKVLTPGMYWVNFNQSIKEFPTYTQNSIWTSVGDKPTLNQPINLQDRDGLVIGIDMGVSYHIDPSKAALVFQKYRQGIQEINDVHLLNIIRDSFISAASSLTAEHMYGAGKNEYMDIVKAKVRKECEPIGIVVENLYWVGDMRLPPQVVKSISDKTDATQKAIARENQVREAEAAAKIDIAKANGKAQSILLEAKAQAEANRLIVQSTTSTLVQYKAIEKWDGKLPTYSGGTIPFINIDPNR